MATNYKTPGVYIEEILTPPSVAPVETGIPAFVGYTKIHQTPSGTNLLMKPTKIFSLLEYLENFGGPQAEDNGISIVVNQKLDASNRVVDESIEAQMDETKRSKHIMYYALQFYFDNGGGPCYIISVGTYSTDGSIVNFSGTTAGTYGLLDGVQVLKNEDEPTIIVVPEAMGLTHNASVTPTTDDSDTLYKAALDQAADLKDRFVIIDVRQINTRTPAIDISSFQTDRNLGDNGKFGAAYYPPIQTTIDFNYFGFENTMTLKKNVTDSTGTTTAVTPDPTLLSLKTADNILYEKVKSAISAVPMLLPASPAMAGIYVKVDKTRGVFKAPANVSVSSLVRPAVKIDNALQDGMNVNPGRGFSVNAIRFVSSRGTVVWGARTLDGNSAWKYVSTRRYFNYVEESVQKATMRFVFEPNDANTWVLVRAMIQNFLTNEWRNGALQGAKPEDAFYVRVGLGQTMSDIDITDGRMIIQIGMAVVKPAEFIILRFEQLMAKS